MANVLYLVHRLPFPPNKGDKVRSYHLLRHLAARHSVFLGTFVDDPEDEVHVQTVRAWCKELHVSRISPGAARIRSLSGLLDGRPLSLAYYAQRDMRNWVEGIRSRKRIDVTVVFSSAMGQYLADDGASSPNGTVLVDFVDVDSSKWTQYASKHRWPMSWVYTREGARLLAYERQLALRADLSFFVTDNEVALFKRLAPECADKVMAISNGVDAHFFAPDPERMTPFPDDELPIVFTGAMDYWPNIDAVSWFVAEMLPALRESSPRIRFYIVGRAPTAAVQALASEAVVVTGTVPDVRPYLQYATVVVAPMRVARGLQNKVLEAMAMGRPVVAAQDCVAAISAVHGSELLAAATSREYVEACNSVIRQPDAGNAIGAAGRRCVVRSFSWDAHLSGIDRHLAGVETGVGVSMGEEENVAA